MNSTASSSRTTSKTGENHYRRFALKYTILPLTPFTPIKLTLKGLTLSFFIACLFENDANFTSSTISNYTSHVKTHWEKNGGVLTEYDKQIQKRVLRGVGLLRPGKPDLREAFLLPHYSFPSIFMQPLSPDQLLLKAAVIFGFLGMFRFSTFAKLNLSATVIVGKHGREYPLKTGTYPELVFYFTRLQASGFYFRFPSKYHPKGRAYYRSLSSLKTPWNALCPVKILVTLARNNLLEKTDFFPLKIVNSKSLGSYMSFVSNYKTHFTHTTLPENWWPHILLHTKYERGFCKLSGS